MEEEIARLEALLDKRDKALQALLEKANADIAANGKLAAETKAALEGLSSEGAAWQERLLAIEQNFAQQLQAAYAQGAGPVSFAEDAIKSAAWQAVIDGNAPSGRFTTNGSWWAEAGWQTHGATINSTPSGGSPSDGEAGDLIVRQRVPGIVAQPDRRLTIRSLMMPGRTSSNSIEYVRESGFTNRAGFVTEGGLKPQSDLQFTIETVNVRTIAHWVKATRQILADAPMLRSYIDGRLRYGIRYREETALMNGSGTGQEIEGIKTVATAYNTALTVTGDNKADVVRRAMMQAELAEYSPTGIILHPKDWVDIELMKETGGAYIWGNPGSTRGPTLWGLPVVTTQAQTEGEFTVGAFAVASQIFDREDVTVELATQHASDFTSNLVTILAEERLAVAHYRPEAIIDGTFP